MYYIAGAVAARTGDEAAGPALLLLGYATTGAVSAGSALLSGLTAAAAVGGPVVGALLDRCRRPGLLLAAILAGYAAGLTGVAVALGRIPLPLVTGMALVTGLAGPVISGGWTAQLPRVLPPERMGRGSALDATTFGVAALAGPTLAGTVATLAGGAYAVTAAATLIAAAAFAAWALPNPPERRRARAPLAADLLAGIRTVTGNRALRRATAVTTVSIAGTGMLVVSTPVLGARLPGGEESGTLLLSAMAAGALLAPVAIARRTTLTRPDAMLALCVLGQAGGTAAVALAATPPALVLAITAAGAAEGLQLAFLISVRHREAPEETRAQVFTIGASLKITALAAGVAAAGPLVDRSVVLCLTAATGLQLAAALLYPLLTSRRRTGTYGRGFGHSHLAQ